MKSSKLLWLVSLALFSGLISMGALHASRPAVRPQLRADGGDPVPPPPPWPTQTKVAGTSA